MDMSHFTHLCQQTMVILKWSTTIYFYASINYLDHMLLNYVTILIEPRNNIRCSMIYVMKSPIGLEFGLGLESGISMGINVRLRVMVMVRLEVRVPNGTNFFLKFFFKSLKYSAFLTVTGLTCFNLFHDLSNVNFRLWLWSKKCVSPEIFYVSSFLLFLPKLSSLQMNRKIFLLHLFKSSEFQSWKTSRIAQLTDHYQSYLLFLDLLITQLLIFVY